MIRWLAWLRRHREPDIDKFFASLTPVQLGASYTRMDRYRDFRRVFGTEDGKRVLWQIFEWTHMFRPIAVKDPHDTYRRDGERNIGLKILAMMNAEPLGEPEAEAEKGVQK